MFLSLVLVLASLPLTTGVTAAASSQSTWTQLSPSTSPQSRFDASMAFDPATGQFILFGGATAPSYLNDTWVWDGSTWIQLSPSTSPGARYGASMVFDPATGQLILFGGYSSGYRNDTWSWDGSTWTKLSPSTSPPSRTYASMVFDPATGQLLLFGGFDSNFNPFNDTWTWDGSTWTKLSPSTSPVARGGASMAFDQATSRLILFGGYDGSGYRNDTWSWDGSTWTQLSPPTSPSARSGASLAFDQATSQLILFGGSKSDFFADTWTWNGSTWIQLNPSTGPGARQYASMAFDPATGQFILFGGEDSSGGVFNDTWTWDGSTWTKLSPPTSPSSRNNASMAFDPATGQLILFGGLSSSSYLNDTWTWDGSTWTKLSPPTSPSARQGASMVFDPAIGQMILFGGVSNSSGYLNDTWTWDGSTWIQLSPSTSPSARYGASVVFNPATGRLILFGGYSSFSVHNDTWELALITDDTPPVTTATAVNADNSAYSFGGWTNQDVTVTLSATDDLSGVASTSYSVDGGNTQTYASPFTISSEGDNTIAYGSVDATGNVEATNTIHVMIDKTAPTVTYTGNLGTYGINDTVNITCTAADNQSGSGVDTSTCQDISGPASSFLFGTNTFTATATDNTGNMGTGSVSFTVEPPASTPLASLVSFSFFNPSQIAFIFSSRSGSAPAGYFSYHDASVSLSQIKLASLVVTGSEATLYGSAQLADGTPVSFEFTASNDVSSRTVRMQLNTGYDSGAQSAPFVRITPSS